MNLVPFKFKPVLKEVLWGTERFKSLCGGEHLTGPVGECWLCVDTPTEQSVIENGPYAGKTFREFLELAGTKFGFAADQCEKYFNMLNKYIDTSDALSVQVHPDNDLAAKFPEYRPKDECWYVIDAKPGAFVYAGLKAGVTRESMAAAIENKTTASLLCQHPAKAGDIFYIPAGMVHALGADLLVAEIGTRSTTTFRLYDWDRVDANGKGRELHISQSLDSSCFDPARLQARVGKGGKITDDIMAAAAEMGLARLLVDCQFFSVAEIKGKPGKRTFTPSVPLMVYQAGGTGRIYSQEQPDQALSMSLGTAVVYPAGVPGTIEYDNDSIILITTPGSVKY